MLGIKASGYYVRQVAFIIGLVAITYCRGTSVVRNLKFLTPSLYSQQSSLLTNVTVLTQVVVTGELPCITNNLY